MDISVRCSSGTYIRAIARDVGARLGVGGHLTALRRTAVGPFDLSVARTLDALADDPTVLPIADGGAERLPRGRSRRDAGGRRAGRPPARGAPGRGRRGSAVRSGRASSSRSTSVAETARWPRRSSSDRARPRPRQGGLVSRERSLNWRRSRCRVLLGRGSDQPSPCGKRGEINGTNEDSCRRDEPGAHRRGQPVRDRRDSTGAGGRRGHRAGGRQHQQEARGHAARHDPARGEPVPRHHGREASLASRSRCPPRATRSSRPSTTSTRDSTRARSSRSSGSRPTSRCSAASPPHRTCPARSG